MPTGTQLWTYGQGSVYQGVILLCQPNPPSGSWYAAGYERSPSNKLRVWKSTNAEGTSWSVQDDSNGPANASSSYIRAVYNPYDGCIYFLHRRPTTEYIGIAVFRTDRASSNQDTWNTGASTALNALDTSVPSGLDYDSNGKVHVAYMAPTTAMGNDYTGVYYTNNISGWKTPVLAFGGASNGYNQNCGYIRTDSSGVPHLYMILPESPADWEWAYGNQNDATSFTKGTLYTDYGLGPWGELFIDSNDKMEVFVADTWWDAFVCWIETTFPSSTKHQWADGSHQIDTGSKTITAGTDAWLAFAYYADSDTNKYMRKHTSSGWDTAKTLLQTDSRLVVWMQNLHATSFPEAMGYFHYDSEAPYFERYIFVLRLIPAAAAAGCEASGHVYTPPLLVTPGDAHAHCAASAIVVVGGGQVVENPIAAGGTDATCAIFQSSAVLIPDAAIAATEASRIISSENLQIIPEPAQAQCWASIGCIFIAGNKYCIPAVARARLIVSDVQVVIDERPFNSGYLRLPALIVHPTGILLHGSIGRANLRLDALTAFGLIVTETLEYGAAVLPSMTAIGSVTTGEVGQASAILHDLQLSGNNTERVGSGHLRLWIPGASGSGITSAIGSGAAVLHRLELSAYGPGSGGEFSGVANFSYMTAQGWMPAGVVMVATFRIPALWIYGADQGTLEMSGAATFPALQGEGYGGENAVGEGHVFFPKLQCVAVIEQDLIANITDGLLAVSVHVMHAENFAVTEWDNYLFNSFASDGIRYLAASDCGIFELAGDDDDGSEIEAEIKKVGVDLETFHHKRITDAYIHLHSSGPYRVLSIVNGVQSDYPVTDVQSSLHSHKANLSRGARGSQIGFGYANDEGSDFILEEIAYLIEATSRRNA